MLTYMRYKSLTVAANYASNGYEWRSKETMPGNEKALLVLHIPEHKLDAEQDETRV